jgi:hypothetical protein
MPYVTKIKAVLELTLKARRIWMDAYAQHGELDEAALRNIVTLQSAVDAAQAALKQEEALEEQRLKEKELEEQRLKEKELKERKLMEDKLKEEALKEGRLDAWGQPIIQRKPHSTGN